MCLFPAQALPTAEPNPTHNLAYCAFMRFCPQLAVRCPTVHTIHTVLQNEAKATTTTTRHCGSDSKYPLWHLRFSLHFPFNISPVNCLAYLLSLSDPTRSLCIVIREHFRHHRAVQWERKSSELRRNTWNALCAPLRCCPFALLLPFCTHKAPISLIMLIMGSTHRHRQAHTHTYSFSIEAQHSLEHVHAIPLAVTTHFFGNITLSLFAKLDRL